MPGFVGYGPGGEFRETDQDKVSWTTTGPFVPVAGQFTPEKVIPFGCGTVPQIDEQEDEAFVGWTPGASV